MPHRHFQRLIPDKSIVVQLDDFEPVAHSATDWSVVKEKIDLRVHNAPLKGLSSLGAIKSAQIDLIAQAHIVSLHLVLSDKTKHVMGAKQFAAMQSGSSFL